MTITYAEWVGDVMEDLEDVIWNIFPVAESFFLEIHNTARLSLRKQFGPSMRARRRRLAKPLRFSPRTSAVRMRLHEWHVDAC